MIHYSTYKTLYNTIAHNKLDNTTFNMPHVRCDLVRSHVLAPVGLWAIVHSFASHVDGSSPPSTQSRPLATAT